MTTAPFRAPFWLRNAHLQTLWASLAPRPKVETTQERIELPDGDFIDLDWSVDPTHEGAPIVIILHGLEGGLDSAYVQGILAALSGSGFRGVLFHFRGCSDGPNRLARAYHSGETGDLHFIATLLRERNPQVPLFAVGYSLGGNVLCKYLGEAGRDSLIERAAAVSVPYDLALCARRLDRGFSRFYQQRLMGSLKKKTIIKFTERRARGLADPLDLQAVAHYRSFRTFDHFVTARLHGFDSADDYYTRSSSGPYLSSVKAPLLLLHARDDPFMSLEAIPAVEALASCVRLELSAHGGHVGFLQGSRPGRLESWLDLRIPNWLRA